MNQNTPTDNAWLDELLDRVFAYGVDWTEFKEDLECGHSTSVYAGKIKAVIKQELRTTIQTHIDTVCREARIDELKRALDEVQYYNDGCGCCQTTTADKDEDLLARLAELEAQTTQLNPNKDTNQVSSKENV